MPIALDDLSLKSVTLDKLLRLKKLRDVHFKTRPAVCTELPLLMTTYMRRMDNASDSQEVRAAKRLKYVLENKKPLIQDDDLLAGTTTTKTKGMVIYPQFMGQALWPELETLPERSKNPYNITQAEIDDLNFKVFPYWMDGTIQEVCRKDYNNPTCQKIMERLVFFLGTKAHVISHTVPDYEVVIEEGLDSIIKTTTAKESTETDHKKKDFYKAVRTVLEGVIAYAQRLSKKTAAMAQRELDPVRKEELMTISKICERVPEKKPQTFHEALQAIWICHVALHQENNNIAMSLGRLDQMLYRLYSDDIKAGTLTPEKAVELVGCFFLRLVDHVPMSPETGEELFGGSGSNQAITIGGVDQNGKNAVNELTYVLLRATELLKVRDPNVNARYCPDENPPEYLVRLGEVNITTKATPCFHNDVEVIKTLLAQNYTEKDARNYSIVGCVEPVCGGKTFGHTGAIMLNLTSALEMALFQGRHRLTEEEQVGPKTAPPSEMLNFSDFLNAFETQLIFLIDQSVELNNMLGKTHLKVHPLPLLSALTKGTMDKGKDVLEGGATYNASGAAIIGLSEVVDSLCALKELVFDKQETAFAELIKAVENDWQGYERLHQKAIHSENKYGAGSREAADMTKYLLDFLHTEYQSRENYRGGKYTVGYWTMTTHAGWGVLTGAMPSGRRNREVLPSGITPVSRQAPDLMESLGFVANLDAKKIANSHALNLKYTPARDPAHMIPKFASSVEAFMKMGGLQVQFNLIDRATLKDAKAHPEKYPNLLVRVSGYTAYFGDLNKYMQEEIIIRAEYDLDTGKEVW
ncbi:MAG: formate acetyltransferase [Candidatus Latescibacteria bacterium]|nr:formate acetyltransferase [Candidatus Latescibacterota bacterium]NIO57232.1 formate acetyltransferase [Candidatus Latescibacterota bacterium]